MRESGCTMNKNFFYPNLIILESKLICLFVKISLTHELNQLQVSKTGKLPIGLGIVFGYFFNHSLHLRIQSPCSARCASASPIK